MSKSQKSKQITMFFFVALAAVAGLYSSKVYFQENSTENPDNITFQSLLTYPKTKTFSGFTLINQDEQNITIDDFANRWTLLFFGFTHCPDVCPTTLTELQKTFKLLEDKKLPEMPQVIFVSVDSERDSSKILKDYIAFFNPAFIAATADHANLLSITSQVGVAYHIGDHQTGDTSYSVDHTAAVFLVDPNKQLFGIFRTPHEATKIAHDLSMLMSKDS